MNSVFLYFILATTMFLNMVSPAVHYEVNTHIEIYKIGKERKEKRKME